MCKQYILIHVYMISCLAAKQKYWVPRKIPIESPMKKAIWKLKHIKQIDNKFYIPDLAMKFSYVENGCLNMILLLDKPLTCMHLDYTFITLYGVNIIQIESLRCCIFMFNGWIIQTAFLRVTKTTIYRFTHFGHHHETGILYDSKIVISRL